ncbi:hypothetical protein AB0M46_47480 [Dactylosporangium sp. NPDC051485]|uniref:hypothetical protein n=1 Tax=Dactylosporangium sp. NPDC051485 TaxID=3154846 RepID=UPI003448331E
MDPVPDTDEDAPRLSVGDPVSRKTRLLARQCDTCIFHPGNRMHLATGRLKAIVADAVADGSYVICHDTLPYGNHPDVRPAVCRGFHDRYRTWRLQLIGRLFGFIEVEPPGPASADTPAG